MSTVKATIGTFLSDLFDELEGYFVEVNEEAEFSIANIEKAHRELTFEDDSSGCCKRCSVTIILRASSSVALSTEDKERLKKLPGQLLRNRPRIESNLLAAIRKLVSDKQENWWLASVIGKVTVEVK